MSTDPGANERAQIDFDHHSPEYARRWPEITAELRAQCPVAHTDAHGGFWVASTYADIFEISRNTDTFSSRDKVNIIPPLETGLTLPIDSDPPDTRRYRSILMPFLTPAGLESLEPVIRAETATAIDAVIGTGRIDFILDLANPIPARTTLRLLGLDPDMWAAYAEPVHDMTFMPIGSPEHDAAVAQVLAFEEVVTAELADRATTPRDDMMSAIVHSEVDGIRTTMEEALAMVLLVIHGGIDTTTSATGNILLYLGRHPERRQAVIDNPGLRRSAIEELLRWEPPVMGFARRATSECVVGGQRIRAGERVYMLFASGNRDESQFEAAHEVRLDRQRNMHLAFGVGPHRCVGATLARLELAIMLDEVLTRMPDYVIEEDGVVDTPDAGLVFGRRRIPARFTASPTTEVPPRARLR